MPFPAEDCKILITGGSGICGSALVNLPYDLTFMDKEQPKEPLKDHLFVQADICDSERMLKLCAGKDILIHLAGATRMEDSWEKVNKLNIQAMYGVMEAARKTGVKKIIFASTNHVVGQYEINNAPKIYYPGHTIMLDHNTPPQPDSFYGVSKIFGEQMGQYYSHTHSISFISIRIGSVRAAHEDHPFAYAEWGVRKGYWKRGDPKYREQEFRLKALWQSRRDFYHMIEQCIVTTSTSFEVFFGVSQNENRWFDISHAQNEIGYQPCDRSEDCKLG